MTLPPTLTTVTPFSKLLAMILFILFPLIGFYLGIKYQQAVTPQNVYQALSTAKPTPTPPPAGEPTANWKTYNNNILGIQFKYPPSWSKEDLIKAENKDLTNLAVCVKRPEDTPYNCSTTMNIQNKNIEQVKQTETKNMGIDEVFGDFGSSNYYPAVTETTSIVIDNKQGYKIKGTVSEPYMDTTTGKARNYKGISYSFLIPIANSTLVFGNVGDKDEMIKILSTFKFIDKGQMEAAPLVAHCDLNADGQCNASDRALFQKALGSHRGDSNYNPLADADADGSITVVDEQMLFP